MNKKLKYGILISIVLLTIIVFISKGTYSATTSYSGTRKNLQDMVIATALSYYYNQNYSDYEQYPMDAYYNSDGDINMEDALNLLKYVIFSFLHNRVNQSRFSICSIQQNAS